MKELVSIITPCYNSADFIEETIQSVLHQTYENWEWLITDDLSHDKTIEIINKYNDPRIKLVVLEKNGLILLVAGGIAYTIGAVLYGLGRKHKYMHSIFHLFIVLGSLLHFFCILFYVV